MMENLLTVVRWAITLPVWLLEHILKGLTFIVLVFGLVVMAILFPLFRSIWCKTEQSVIFKYATKWREDYPLTKKVFDLWKR